MERRILPCLYDKVSDETSAKRTWRHPFKGKSAEGQVPIRSATLLEGPMALKFGQSALALPGLAVVAPLYGVAAFNAAKISHRQFTTVYPAAVSAADAQRVRVADSRAQDLERPHEPNLQSDRTQHEETRLDRLDVAAARGNEDRLLSPLVAGALAGYSGALGIMGCSAAVGVVKSAGVLPVAASVMPALGIAATSVLFPAQILMASYAAGKAVSGVKRIGRFDGDAKALAGLQTAVDPKSLQSAEQQVRRLRNYQVSHVVGSSVGVTSQLVLAAGGITTLSGVGAPVGAVLTGVGLSLVVAAGAIGTVTTHKHNVFTGVSASPLATAAAKSRDTAGEIERSGLTSAIGAASNEHLRNQRDLAEAKLMSLVLYVLDNESSREGLSAQALEASRLSELGKLARTGRKLPLARTTLLGTEVSEMQKLFWSKYAYSGFLSGTKHEITQRVNGVLLEQTHAKELADSGDLKQRILRKTIRDLQHERVDEIQQFLAMGRGVKKRSISDHDLSSLLQSNARASEVATRCTAVERVRQTKTDLAYKRTGIVANLVDLGYTATEVAKHKSVALGVHTNTTLQVWPDDDTKIIYL